MGGVNGTHRVPDGHLPPSAEQWPRQSYDKHRAQVRASNRARAKAVKLLIEETAPRYDELYAEQCALEDPPVVPMGRRADQSGRAIQRRIDKLQAQLARIQGDGDGQA